MAIPKLEKELNYISKLGNYPNTDNALSPEELKLRFDQAGLDIQDYLNSTLVPALEENIDAKDSALHVTVREEAVDYTAAEIYERLQDKENTCHVYLNIGEKFIPLARISESQAVFEELVYREATDKLEENFFLTRWSFGNDHTLNEEEFFIPLDGTGGSGESTPAQGKGKAGIIYPLAAQNVPRGFLLCDGAEYRRIEYPELFAAIGTTYGAGDGSKTFNVPNLSTRVPVGAGENYPLGKMDGEEKHTLTVDEMPTHNHTNRGVLKGTHDNWEEVKLPSNTITHESYDAAGTTIKRNFAENGETAWTGGSQPHNNMQPYTVVNYIISTGKATEFVVGGGGDSAIHVIVDYNENGELMANYSPAEIYQRLQADGNSCSVYLHILGGIHPLTQISENYAEFATLSILNNEIYSNTLLSITWSFGNDRLVHGKEEYIPLGCDKDAVLYTEQDLPPEQQAQARKNIDACAFKEVVDNLCPTFIESGSTVICKPVEGYPLGVVSKIEPIQPEGVPSLNNICPISGHSAVKLTRSGKNLLAYPYTGISANGTKTVQGITYKDNGDGSITINGTAGSMSFINLATNVDFGATIDATASSVGKSNGTYTVGKWLYYDTATKTVRVNILKETEVNNVTIYPQVELGTIETAYEPYRGDTFTANFGQTVYGGSLNWNTGELTVNMVQKLLDGKENWSDAHYSNVVTLTDISVTSGSKVLSNIFQSVDTPPDTNLRTGTIYAYGNIQIGYRSVAEDLAGFKAFLAEQYSAGTPVQLCYTLKTPTTIQLTPQEIIALSGVNTLYSSTGDTEVTGRADPTAIFNDLYDKVNALSSAMAAITGVQ